MNFFDLQNQLEEQEEEEEEEEACEVDPNVVFEKYKDDWYKAAVDYWAKQEKTVDGMLGGFQSLSGFDAFSSRNIIQKYQNPPSNSNLTKLGNKRVSDCGAGIGRVSHLVLADFFENIDLVEPVSSLLDEAKKILKKDKVNIRTFALGAQSWTPDREYDAFWLQWTLMYLKDDDAVLFLKRCKEHLNQNGYIFVKDNVSSADVSKKKDSAQFFIEDHGLCRVHQHYLELFEAAELKVIEIEKQDNWPDDLIPVFTFVLK